jgi:serine/threonine protein kinase
MTLQEAAQQLKIADCPEAIFDGVKSLLDLKKTFHAWSMVVHPDGKKTKTEILLATAAFARLSELNEMAKEKLKAGNYGNRLIMKKVTLKTKSHSYDLTERIPDGDISNVYGGRDERGKEIVAKVGRLRNNDLLTNEQEILSYLWNEARTKSLPAMAHIPKLVESFELRYSTARKWVNVIERKVGYVTLADILKAVPAGLDLRDAAWMFNRLLAALCIPHQAHVVHGAVLPQHFLIHGEKHNGVLIDWCYAKRNNKPLTVVVPGQHSFYPEEVFAKKPSHKSMDVYMAAHCFIALLGKQWNTCPRPIKGIVNTCLLGPKHRPSNVFELHKDFNEQLKTVLGPRKYRKFEMPVPA